MYININLQIWRGSTAQTMASQPPPKKEAYHYSAGSYRVKSHEGTL